MTFAQVVAISGKALIFTIFLIKFCTCEPTVTINTGTLIGSVHASYDGRLFDAFLGIPYAQSPTGQLRFKPPEPAQPWSGIFDATKDGSQCPNAGVHPSIGGVFSGDENCLFINVYRPQVKSDQLLPILVYIHGGAFYLGSARMEEIGPAKFMDMDIVLVTMNYRLGVLGFLSTNDENAYGNYGLLDQVMALRWVQENIDQFNGDREKVTISGMSAGAGSVAFLVVSPLTKGLFRAAIAQSGTTQSHWSIQEKPRLWAERIAEKVNCQTDDTRELVECLRVTSAEDLVHAFYSLQFALLCPLYLSPVIEVPGGSGFLTEDPWIIMKEGRFNKVPFITGTTKDDGYLFALGQSFSFKTRGEQFFNEEFPTRYLPHFINVQPPEQERLNRIAKLIQKEYIQADDDLNDQTTFLERYSEILGDLMFFVGRDETLRLISNAGVDTYAYQFTYKKKFETLPMLAGDKHVNHGDEIWLQFVNKNFIEIPAFASDDIVMGKIINQMWINFAYTLKPSFIGTQIKDESLVWSLFDAENPNYLELCLNPTMKEGNMNNHTRFWTETIYKLSNDDLTERDEL